MKSEIHLDIYGGRRVKPKDRNKNVFARPYGLRENGRITISCRGLGLKRRKRGTSSREEEEAEAQMCPCGKAIENRTHIVLIGESERYEEERDVLEEEMREIDECDMEEFGTLDSSEETIAILGDRW